MTMGGSGTEVGQPAGEPLGSALRRSRGAIAAAALAAAALVGGDLLLSALGRHSDLQRCAMAAAAIVLFGWLARWRWRGLGLRLRPVQGWGHWAKWTAKLGAVIVLLFMALPIWLIRAGMLQVPAWSSPLFTEPWQALAWLPHACLVTPVTEEFIYRFVLCVPVAAAVGERSAIVASGLAFALLHVLYGCPAPDNLLAGFILGWAFVKSRSLALPILLHALGNLLVAAYHIALLQFVL